MGVAQPLDKKITHYLGHLSTEQKKVVLSVVKSFAREEEAWIDDNAYIDEMDRRFKDLETGKVKGLKLEDLATRARQAYPCASANDEWYLSFSDQWMKSC